jgi:hypothetical protein
MLKLLFFELVSSQRVIVENIHVGVECSREKTQNNCCMLMESLKEVNPNIVFFTFILDCFQKEEVS